jgi:hypothetical protein
VHPCPHQDGAGLEIIEGGPRRGVAAPPIVTRVAGAIALAFPLALALAFAAIVCGGGRGGKGLPED